MVSGTCSSPIRQWDPTTTSCPRLCNNDTYECQESIRGSGATVRVTLTVSDTITGPDGYSVRFVPVTANGMAWDPDRKLIYAATRDPWAVPEVVAINPQSGQIVARTQVGGDPYKLAISADGRFLYVGRNATSDIQRLTLPELTAALTIPLPTSPSASERLRAIDIEVSPDDSRTIAVAVGMPVGYSPSCHSLVIYDDEHVRAELPGWGSDERPCVRSIEWGGSGSLLFGDDSGSYPADLYRIVVDAASMSSRLLTAGSSSEYSGPIAYRSGFIFSSGGAIYDPATATRIGQFASSPSHTRTPALSAPEINRVFWIDEYYSGVGGLRIASFNMMTGEEIGSIDLPRLSTQRDFTGGGSLAEPGLYNAIRWGEQGLAVPLVDGRILLVEGAFVGPGP